MKKEDGALIALTATISTRELAEQLQEILPTNQLLDLISAIVGVGYDQTGIENTAGMEDCEFARRVIVNLTRQYISAWNDMEGGGKGKRIDEILEQIIADAVMEEL